MLNPHQDFKILYLKNLVRNVVYINSKTRTHSKVIFLMYTPLEVAGFNFLQLKFQRFDG